MYVIRQNACHMLEVMLTDNATDLGPLDMYAFTSGVGEWQAELQWPPRSFNSAADMDVPCKLPIGRAYK